MEFTRGDTYNFKFQRKNSDGTVIQTKADKMWFTVKKGYDTNKVIQKTLTNGITFNTTDYYYHVTISSIDTRDLTTGDYYYDIQVMNNTTVSTIANGTLTLRKDVTTDYE